MKKMIIITGLVLVVLFTALAVLPLFFKQTLLEKTKSTINKNVNAKVEFAGLRLSLIRHFPNLFLELSDVSVTGKGEFQSDTLLVVPALQTKTSLRQLFNKEGIGIEEIILNRPRLKLVVGSTGEVNWDLAGEEETAAPEGEESDLALQLEKVRISDAGFIYEDRELDMDLRFENIDLDVSGKMYGTAADLMVSGTAERFSLEYDSVKYISNMAVETRTLLQVDYDKMDIGIQENELLINRLPLEVLGTIRIPNDSMFFDLRLQTKESGFDNFLALIPPGYESMLEQIRTSGSAVISGSINGYYLEEEYPAIDLNMDVANGELKYSNLPEAIKNITANVSVTKPQGILDSTRITIQQAHAEVKNSPVDLRLLLENPVSDPYFDGAFAGNINFSEWKDALPLDSIDISGTIDANLKVKGNYSAIEKELYEKIASDGTIRLSDFIYESPGLTQKIRVPAGLLAFSPQSVQLSEMNVGIGQSDFRLSGRVSNYLNYLLKDGTLTGNLQLNSSLVNLNELLRLQVKADTIPEEQVTAPAGQDAADSAGVKEVLVFDVPNNIDFTFQSAIQRMIFDQVPVTDVNGLITARNGKLVLDGLNMHLLDGEMTLTGSYENTNENTPLFDFSFDLLKIDIPTAYQTLSSIRRMLPIARQSQGKFNTSLRVNGQLSPGFGLLSSSVDGNGFFSTENLQINESSLFNQLKGILNAETLKKISVDDFRASVEVVDGTIRLNPFTTRIAGQETTIAGNLNPENLLEMQLDFNVQREAFGPDIQNILNVLPGQEEIRVIPATVMLNGPVGKPEVKIDLDDARKMITEQVRKSTKDNLNKLGEGLKKLFE